ncbi:hypothetical protein VDGE_30648 [Verticillium dahliae]|uniref:Uncharacterized protein n=1 Tax=Verticillium dahliae TaxID=27337 RepID=A0A444S4Y9_VERDA|nr:hypothetical protein VDGE_30648 [Verticillium dahliae]
MLLHTFNVCKARFDAARTGQPLPPTRIAGHLIRGNWLRGHAGTTICSRTQRDTSDAEWSVARRPGSDVFDCKGKLWTNGLSFGRVTCGQHSVCSSDVTLGQILFADL